MKNGGMPSPVVFFSLFRTDNPYSSISLSMARVLAGSCRVIYVNHPYSWKDVAKGIWTGDAALRRRLPGILFGRNVYEHLDAIPENFIAVQPPVTLPINWLPPGRLYDLLQGVNNRIVLRSIRKALNRFHVRNFVFINCYDPFFAGNLPAEMHARCCIYHCIDDITQNDYTARHGLKLENEACGKADITFVTSTRLYQLKAPHAKRLVPYFNAADVRVFEKARLETYPRPRELDRRPGKVIGFVGNLDNDRIDYGLLKQTAEAFQEATLLLVGPLNSPQPAAIGLDRLPNVVFAGSRPLDELPPLLQHMDCVLIPFLCNTLTESIYPLKINEYLAAGKPVVSTSFSEDIRTFAPVIYLANNPDDFIRKITSALQENDPQIVEKRVQTARSNTWEARIDRLWEVVDDEPKRPG